MVLWFSSLIETGVNQGYVNNIGRHSALDYWNASDDQAGGIDDSYRQQLAVPVSAARRGPAASEVCL